MLGRSARPRLDEQGLVALARLAQLHLECGGLRGLTLVSARELAAVAVEQLLLRLSGLEAMALEGGLHLVGGPQRGRLALAARLTLGRELRRPALHLLGRGGRRLLGRPQRVDARALEHRAQLGALARVLGALRQRRFPLALRLQLAVGERGVALLRCRRARRAAGAELALEDARALLGTRRPAQRESEGSRGHRRGSEGIGGNQKLARAHGSSQKLRAHRLTSRRAR